MNPNPLVARETLKGALGDRSLTQESSSIEALSALFAPEAFRTLGHKLIDLIADHHAATIGGERDQTLPWQPPDEQLQWWRELDATDVTPEALFQHILSRSVAIHDPRFIGHQVGMSAPTGVLFGLLSSYLNNGMAVYEMGMAANCMEKLIVEECCRRFGYQLESAGGILTSGGTLANLTAMLSARQAKQNIWAGKQPALLVSAEAHYCIERAATTMGWPREAIRKVPTDKEYRMQTELLEPMFQQAAAEGFAVFTVIGSACSTSTGSYDDLHAIADFCERRGLWFHVDGAHGAATIFTDAYKHLLDGIERADSIVLDFHKLLMTPGLATAVLYKRNIDSFNTFRQEAAYLLDLERDWFNSGKRTYECTKYMISAKIYGLVKTHGWEIFGHNVETLYQHARQFGAWLERHEDFQLGAPVRSNIICFRYVREDLSPAELDRHNAAIRQRVVERGAYYIVQTTLRDGLYLRLTVMNPFTTQDHIETLCTEITSIAASLT